MLSFNLRLLWWKLYIGKKQQSNYFSCVQSLGLFSAISGGKYQHNTCKKRVAISSFIFLAVLSSSRIR